jgi:hypothetical protein
MHDRVDLLLLKRVSVCRDLKAPVRLARLVRRALRKKKITFARAAPRCA